MFANGEESQRVDRDIKKFVDASVRRDSVPYIDASVHRDALPHVEIEADEGFVDITRRKKVDT